MCVHMLILSQLHVPDTRPCYMSPQCALHQFFVAATCPCNMTPRVCPPLRVDLHSAIFGECDKLTTGLRHDLDCHSVLKHVLKCYDIFF